jgi:predicted ATP-grasp superfamily ATP-dependent carboligase
MGRVLITDAGGRNVVSAVRSLGKMGITVVGADESRLALSFFSKYCNEKLIYPSHQKYPIDWLNWLVRELSTRSYEMVMPISDNCVEMVSKNRDIISQYTKVPVVDHATWMKARDKSETLKFAMQAHVPHPETRFIAEINEVEAVANEMEFPVVIKPKQSCGSRGIVYVPKPENLHKAYLSVHNAYPFPMVQEFIPRGGSTYGVSLLFNKEAEPRAVFAHKRLREFPVKGGPSTLRESVHNPELVDMAVRLLKSINWYGVAMVEFKEDPRDGQYKIMEINPRFWGSLPLAILAGVDFPYLLYRMVMDGDVEPVMNYPEGVRCRWLLPGDILHFIWNPQRFRLKPSFFNFSKNNRHDDFISLEDPFPTLGFFIIAFANFFR